MRGVNYVLLAFLALAMGFNTNGAVRAFQSGQFFAFGVHLAFDIWWVLKMVELVFDL